MARRLLDHKRILIVDDEEDVLNTLESLLPMCKVVKASTFQEAEALLGAQFFHMAILDIMGVDGYKLLEIARQYEIIPVMLTAHALSPEDTFKSFKEGAAYYVPKEKMEDIAIYLEDVLEAKEQGKNVFVRWLERFEEFYDHRFGQKWRDLGKDWEKGYWEP